MNFERNLKDFTRVLFSGGRPLSLRDEGSEGKGGAGQRWARGRGEPLQQKEEEKEEEEEEEEMEEEQK